MNQPVLIGVARCHEPADPLTIMELAARAATADAGAPSLLGRVQQILMPRGTWTMVNPGAALAARLGCAAATSVVADVGVPQQTLVSRALTGIRDGSFEVALVVGAEARAWAVGGGASDDPSPPGEPDVVLRPHGVIVSEAEIAAKFWEPVQQYAVIESALLHAEGGSVADIDALYQRFADVAMANPSAAFAAAAERFVGGERGRLLAHPYRKWHSTQWTVDQGAALLLCSADVAREVGVPLDRWVFPRVALESSYAIPLAARADLHRWPAMKVLGSAAAAALRHPLSEIVNTEVYSCFPVAVRVQQRELGLPTDGVPTITGGMAFAGGPFNNFTYQATVSVIDRLRADAPGAVGLVTTVSGLLTKPGVMVWSNAPCDLVIDDLAAEVEATTAVCPVDPAYEGEATIVGWTATGDGQGEAIVIAESPDGSRTVARSAEDMPVEDLASSEPIGHRIDVRGGAWRF